MLIATPTLQEKSALGSEWEIRSPGQGFQPLVPVAIWFSKKREMAVKTESKWLVVFLSSVSRSSSFPADRLFFPSALPSPTTSSHARPSHSYAPSLSCEPSLLHLCRSKPPPQATPTLSCRRCCSPPPHVWCRWSRHVQAVAPYRSLFVVPLPSPRTGI